MARKGIRVEDFWKLVDEHFGKNKHYLSVREVNEIKARFGVSIPAAVFRSRVRPGYEGKVVRPKRGRPRKNVAGAVVVSKPSENKEKHEKHENEPVIRAAEKTSSQDAREIAGELIKVARESNNVVEGWALRDKNTGHWIGEFLSPVNSIALAKFCKDKPNVSNKGRYEIVRVRAGYVMHESGNNFFAKHIPFEVIGG